MITRKEALAKNLTTYFTGRACKNGHIAERSCRKCECLECKANYTKSWDKSHPMDVARRRKKYREEHSQVLKQRQREYYEANRKDFVLRARSREIAKQQRTPAWADSKAIAFFYECCPAGCHVDHIIPLQGKAVSGLHVETNLQWLPAKENLSKGNKYSL